MIRIDREGEHCYLFASHRTFPNIMEELMGNIHTKLSSFLQLKKIAKKQFPVADIDQLFKEGMMDLDGMVNSLDVGALAGPPGGWAAMFMYENMLWITCGTFSFCNGHVITDPERFLKQCIFRANAQKYNDEQEAVRALERHGGKNCLRVKRILFPEKRSLLRFQRVSL